jgi:serine/threonine protein kinase
MAEQAGEIPGVMPLRSYDPPGVGPYELLGRLGSGGQADVYLGRDREGRRVAVRTIRESFDDPYTKERFARELDLAKRVLPFCTAPIIAHDVDADPPYVVSEYIPGPTLHRYVHDHGPMDRDNIVQLAVGTATALTAIHRVGVVHCDFKPDNVILGPLGPRVIDFGVAQALDGTMTTTVRGTPPYLAPERFAGEPARKPCDIFAWAATIAFAASGHPPFGRDDRFAVRDRVLNHPPDLAGLPEGLEGLIRDCLDKDENRRPTAEQVLFRLLGHGEEAAPTVKLETVLKEGRDEARQLRTPVPVQPPPVTTPQPPAMTPATTPAMTPATMPVPAPATTLPQRLRAEYANPWAVSVAIFLGAAGGAAGYVSTAAAGTAAAIGAGTFAVVYVVRLVLAAVLNPDR